MNLQSIKIDEIIASLEHQRLIHGYTIDAICLSIGIPKKTYYNFIQKVKKPQMKTLYKIFIFLSKIERETLIDYIENYKN